MSNQILFLHLSDIHLKTSEDLILNEVENIAKSLYEYLPKSKILLIVISGDIAFSGQEKQYESAHKFLDELISIIKNEKLLDIYVVLVPGNHDLDFVEENKLRDTMLQNLKQDITLLEDSKIRALVLEPQKNYLQFKQEVDELYNTKINVFGDDLYQKYQLNINDMSIDITALNVAICSQRKENMGDLVFPIELYASSFDLEVDFNITVFHQPAHWHRYESYMGLRNIIKQFSDLILTGHEHVANYGEVRDLETGIDGTFFIEAGVLQEKSDNIQSSSFNVLILDPKKELHIHEYVRKSDRYFKNNTKNFPLGERDKCRSRFRVEEKFLEKITDVGSYFKHHSREQIKLSDIYIYPQFKSSTVSQKSTSKYDSNGNLISSEILLEIDDKLNRFIFVLGDEKFGKSSLLYMAYQAYLNKGLIPLLIDGGGIKRGTDIEKLIKKEYEKQYASDWNEYAQVSKKRKVLLIDNIDLSIEPEKKVEEFKEYFSSIILTAHTLFESERIIGSNADLSFIDFQYYTLVHFGHVLREKLISKWVALGLTDANNQITDDQFLQQTVEAKKQIDVILGTGVVPPIPLYLLTLLQTFQSTASSLHVDSSLGHYYHALITIAFDNIGKSKDINEIFDYLTELAWFIHEKSPNDLSYDDLQEFNRSFSNEWHTVEFGTRLRDLINARIIEKDAFDKYKFKYPYIYYYLKGKYLKEHFNNDDINQYIRHCCKHLYIRKNGNTILFLAHHHSKSLEFLEILKNTLSDTLEKYLPVKFNKDTLHLSQFVKSSSLLIENKNVSAKQNRTEIHHHLDELDNSNIDEQLEKEDELDELDLIAEINVLFKTTEIIGQILKNQYSSLKKTDKNDLLIAVIEGMLRGLQSFYTTLIDDPNVLVQELQKNYQNNSANDEIKSKELAERFVSQVIKLISTGMIVKAITSINSKKLQESIKVIDCDDNYAKELIKVGTLLDSFGSIPFDELKELLFKLKGENIAISILYFLILRRVHLFPIRDVDIQRLNAIFDLDQQSLKQITYLNRGTKLLD